MSWPKPRIPPRKGSAQGWCRQGNLPSGTWASVARHLVAANIVDYMNLALNYRYCRDYGTEGICREEPASAGTAEQVQGQCLALKRGKKIHISAPRIF